MDISPEDPITVEAYLAEMLIQYVGMFAKPYQANPTRQQGHPIAEILEQRERADAQLRTAGLRGQMVKLVWDEPKIRASVFNFLGTIGGFSDYDPECVETEFQKGMSIIRKAMESRPDRNERLVENRSADTGQCTP